MGCWRGSSARGLVPLLRTRRFLEAGARAAALCLSQVWAQGPGWGWEHVRREGATLCFLVGCLDAALPHTCLRPSPRPASPPPSPAAPGDAAGRGVHLHMMQRQPYLLPNRALASPFPPHTPPSPPAPRDAAGRGAEADDAALQAPLQRRGCSALVHRHHLRSGVPPQPAAAGHPPRPQAGGAGCGGWGWGQVEG